MTTFEAKDNHQLLEKGITEKKVLDQIETFKEGIPFVHLEKAAIISNGILKYSPMEEKELVATFDKLKAKKSLLKFVPASGAASRMFKALFNFLEAYDPTKEGLKSYLDRTKDKDIKVLVEGIKKFPFYNIIENRIAGKAKSKDEKVYLFVQEMLAENKLNYGFYPKGLLPFHEYGQKGVTPFEEHLKEGSLYAKVDGAAHLHFTISEQHDDMFKNEFKEVGDRVSKETGTEFHVSYSYQKPATDTIAVTLENELFRNPDGSLLFRPGGHGALIENLNEQDADIIFIKNIDNVVVDKVVDQVATSKKVLAGLLLKLQEKAFAYAALLEKDEETGEEVMEIKSFLENELNVRFVPNFDSFTIAQQLEILKDKINRPIRVCGMVKNEGEPGGGPFWVKDKRNHISLQIIESAQVDMSNSDQVEIFKNSTHFNPVDLVCGVKNFKGEKFNLLNFVDHKQGFITEKTKDGKDLKALELPGLWNGAMAFWNTIFVEVPLVTFNPVKTVNDLLKPTHQVK
ncbi:DUF4301 family protein [Flavobacteriaceae bacterium KMM 6898]|nr:DUF4301 family protein [Flavobacteriaceae bacterium KMM 6898]